MTYDCKFGVKLKEIPPGHFKGFVTVADHLIVGALVGLKFWILSSWFFTSITVVKLVIFNPIF